MRKNLDIKLATVEVAKQTKSHGQSVKARIEELADTAAMDFYQECADKSGLTIEEWLDKANKGEF